MVRPPSQFRLSRPFKIDRIAIIPRLFYHNQIPLPYLYPFHALSRLQTHAIHTMSQPRNAKGKGKGGRDVLVSKALSHLLRHAAEKEGIKMDSQGYANVADVVCARYPS